MKTSNLYKLRKGCANEVAVTESFKALMEGRECIEAFGSKLRRSVSSDGTEFFRLDTAVEATIIVTKPTPMNNHTSFVRMLINEVTKSNGDETVDWHPSFRGQIKISPKDRRSHLYFFDPFHEEYLHGFLDAAMNISEEKDIELSELIPEDMKAQMTRARLLDMSNEAQAACARSTNAQNQADQNPTVQSDSMKAVFLNL